MMKPKLFALLVVAVATITTGCTALRTFPHVARAGDTIALSIGSPDGLDRTTLQSVTFEYDGGPSPVDLKPYVRALFNLYADKNSKAYSPGLPPGGLGTNLLVGSSGHEPYSTIMVIDLPDIATEPGLVPGTGHVVVRTVAGTVTYPTINSHINNLETLGKRIDLEILPGAGQRNPFTYEFGIGAQMPPVGGDDLPGLEPLPRILVRPPFQQVSPFRKDLGAAEVKVDLSSCNNKGAPLTDSDLRVVADDMTMNTLSQRSVMSSVDGSGDILTVIFLSTVSKLAYYEPRFSVILKDGLAPGCNPWFYTNSGAEPGVTHYDINGVLIADATVPAIAANPASPNLQTEYSVELR